MSATASPARGGLVAPVLGGLAAGLVAGMFGVGGGILLVPLLVLVLGRPQHVAHATSLVAVTLAASAGVARFAIGGSVAVTGGIVMAVGAVAGAGLGAALLPKVEEGALRIVFAVALIGLALRFVLVGASGDAAAAGDFVPDLTLTMLALHALGGLVAGVASSVLGIGGGAVMVPLLVIGFGYGQHVAEGTSLAIIVPTALTGAIAHHRNGYTEWPVGLKLGVASVAGSLLGASIALALSPVTLGRLFGGLQLVVGVLMLNDIRRARRRGRQVAAPFGQDTTPAAGSGATPATSGSLARDARVEAEENTVEAEGSTSP